MRRIALISTVALIALLALGVGFARWFDVLTIDGTVETGEVIAELTADQPVNCLWDEKNVSQVTRELSDTDGNGYNDQMTVTVEDAYPGVQYQIPFDVHSWGDIPIHVKVYSGDHNFQADWGSWAYGYSGGGTPSPSGWWEYVQLHQGEAADYRLYITFDGVPENETFYFTFYIDCGQYNEPNEDPAP